MSVTVIFFGGGARLGQVSGVNCLVTPHDDDLSDGDWTDESTGASSGAEASTSGDERDCLI